MSSVEEFSSEGSNTWNIYTSSETVPSQTGKGFGTSMNAISIGIVATAILISMFLIMAIFEHLFRPSQSTNDVDDSTLEAGSVENKSKNPQAGSSSSSFYGIEFSVLMPGQQCPTYIAQPAPLPCPREGIHWPSH